MVQERLAQADLEYEARAEELHRRLVAEVEAVYTNAELGHLDDRVRQALIRVRRHRHIPFEYYAQSRKPWEILEDAYSNKVIDLDPSEALLLACSELISRKVDLGSVPKEQLFQALGRLAGRFASTASEPAIVSVSTQAVLTEKVGKGETEGEWKALDIGAGLGYQTAILRTVGFSQVEAIEIKPYLVKQARRIIEEEGYDGINFICGDGRFGYPNGAPYDAIVVGAAVGESEVVERLKSQLKIGGRLVLPEVVCRLPDEEIEVGGKRVVMPQSYSELRLYVSKSEAEFLRYTILPVRFVDLREWNVDFDAVHKLVNKLKA